MGVFKSEKTFHASPELIHSVGKSVAESFRHDGFETAEESLASGGVDISITKGGAFQAVVGLKSALKIKIVPIGSDAFHVEAGVGIFGQQAIPTAISMILAWPVLIPQIWGMVQQSKLDEKALGYVQEAIDRHPSSSDASAQFCPHCGHTVAVGAKFCGECGGKV
jgi:hypothetical protein